MLTGDDYIGGAANAWTPSTESEELARRQGEEELQRMRDVTKERVKELEEAEKRQSTSN